MTEPVSLRMDSDYVQYLRYLARFRSIGSKDVPYTELIRQAVIEAFPMPSAFNANTMDMSLASGIFCQKEAKRG